MTAPLDEATAKIIAAALFKYANPDSDWQGDQLALAVFHGTRV
jgi:hypothetical protein